MTDRRDVRIGIDVGGTFTHAVAIDHKKLSIIKKACSPTTHGSQDGVAEGIWKCLEELLGAGEFGSDDVVFVANSTTQATNALLEGDVSGVTLVGIVDGVAGAKGKRELSFGNVPVTGDKEIPVETVFLNSAEAVEGVKEYIKRGRGRADVFVVAEPFAVDDPEREIEVAAAISGEGIPVTASHEVSGLYGLRARARTSVVNASILPKMMDVARKTGRVVEKLGLRAGLMIMRSDGGVMAAERMETTPILTILSGPAAGVSAAILYEKIANGFFVEVGGTSTDISLIIDGKPQRKQAVIGGNILYLKTIDVRTVGVAGGSMVRLNGNNVADVGPRSAHIAGLPYACFTDPAAWVAPVLKLVSPRPGDPADYLVVDTGSGITCAVTTTCAANAIGFMPEGDYATGSMESAKKAFDLIAEKTGRNADDLARKVLGIAAARVQDVCNQLKSEYTINASGLTLIGGGGGASVIAPGAAELLGMNYRRARDAEVISAIGVGMALLKNVIEKSVVDPTEEDMISARAEVIKSLVESGADPGSVEVEIEVDAKKNLVRAVATGSTTLVSESGSEAVTVGRAVEIARENSGVEESLGVVYEDSACFVVSGTVEKRGFLGINKKVTTPVVVVDSRGLARLTLNNAEFVVAGRSESDEALKSAIGGAVTYGDGGAVLRQTYMVLAGKVIELSSAGEREKMIRFAELELADRPDAESFCLIFKK
ncbi:MAG TPA: hydantoinase/oxoprolinase family protein [bacterium]|nr:hydantoinase/oxoprolinase family protein [bacterium]